MGGFAWVTLATNDSYSLGALVLAHSLRRVATQHELAVLVTPGVTQVMREKLSNVFNLVKEVNVLDSKDEANLALLARPELGITFTKLHCWRLTQYEKCVFVDADALVIRNCDELFEREELTAAPDVGWPDCFNSGVFVFKPSQQTFASLISFAAAKGSFDGGDQGLLNSYFSDWAHKDISKHLPFIYNMCSTATYSYLPAYKQFGDNARIVHFIGATKPWLQFFNTETGVVQPPSGCNHLQPLLQLWWNIFCDSVHPQLSPVMASSTLATIWHKFARTWSPGTTASPPSFRPISHDHYHHQNQNHSNLYVIQNRSALPPTAPYDTDAHDFPDFSDFNDPWEEFKDITESTIREESSQYRGPEDNNSRDQSYSTLTSSQQPRSEDHSNPWNREDDRFRDQRAKESRIPTFHRHETNTRRDRSDTEATKIVTIQDRIPSSEESRSREEVSHRYESSSPREHRWEYNKNERNISNDIESRLHDDNRERNDHFQTNYDENTNKLTTIDPLPMVVTTSDENDDRDDEQTDPTFQSQSLIIEPCTDPRTVAHQSEQSISINETPSRNDDAGIAGALAQLTLGEARSDEQVALEEHMRRQGWEHGQIDYLGRDSFDNIWKKISNTLSKVPARQASPPKETPVVPSEMAVAPTPVAPTIAPSSTEEVEAPIAAATTDSIVETSERSEARRETVDTITTPTIDPNTETESTELTSTVQLDSNLNVTSEIATPISEQSLPTPSSTVSEPSSEPVQEQIVIAAPQEAVMAAPREAEDVEPPKEVAKSVSESPVPIQVAESVLESEPKESVSEDPNPVREEILASVVSPVLESATAVSETPIEPSIPTEPVKNGIDHVLHEEPSPLSPGIEAQPPPPATNGLSSPPIDVVSAPRPDIATPGETLSSEPAPSAPITEPSPTIDPIAVAPTPEAESTPKPESIVAATFTSATEPEAESPVEAPASETTVSTSKSESEAGKSTEEEEVSNSSSITPPESPTDSCPVRPVRSKEPRIPSTPTVTEATPPNSPPIGSVQNLESEPKPTTKVVKKVVKKVVPAESTEAEEGEATTKKVVKKVVKRVVKKAKDDGEEPSASTDKPAAKKVVKIVKKVVSKPGENLDVDESVPETPPAGSSDAPVPPKRKVKTTTTTTTTTKTTTDDAKQ